MKARIVLVCSLCAFVAIAKNNSVPPIPVTVAPMLGFMEPIVAAKKKPAQIPAAVAKKNRDTTPLTREKNR